VRDGRFLGEAKLAQASRSISQYLRLNLEFRHRGWMTGLLERSFGQHAIGR
jgi:hypothetical protein